MISKCIKLPSINFKINFNFKFIRGVNHDQVVDALSRLLRKDQVVDIQITDKDCIITLRDELAKFSLMSHSQY